METKHINITDTFTIPDKCRKIGNPDGKSIIYIEDYVHTFIKQNLQNEKKPVRFQAYGRIYQIEARYHILIELISEEKEEEEKDFPKEKYLGILTVQFRKKFDNKWSIKGDFLGNISFDVEEYYIYYEKNEMMQNYLIHWHEQRDHAKEKEENELPVKYTRALQNQKQTEKEEITQKKYFASICLFFLVIFSIMLISIVNNYQKMRDLQNNIVSLKQKLEATGEFEAIETVNQIVNGKKPLQTKESIADKDTTKKDEMKNDGALMEEASEQNEEKESESANTNEETKLLKETTESGKTEENTVPEQSENTEINKTEENDSEEVAKNEETNTITYEIYKIQKGDTLRTILYKKYGNIGKLNIICELNQLKNPDEIKEGTTLYLPQ